MRRARSSRGWTLLETLIVLGLIVMLAALVLPAALESLEDRAFDSSADVVTSQILMARSHAQATGTPMEVVYEADPPRVKVRQFQPEPSAAQRSPFARGDTTSTGAGRGNPTAAPARNSNSGRSAEHDETAGDSAKVPDFWASRALAEGLTIQDCLPAAEGSAAVGFEIGSPSPDAIDGMGLDAAATELRLAVMLPDGTSMMSRPAWLTDGDGRVAELLINAWTGEPLVQRVEPAAGEEARENGEASEVGKPSRSRDRSRPDSEESIPLDP